jgi:hypothetical protein
MGEKCLQAHPHSKSGSALHDKRGSMTPLKVERSLYKKPSDALIKTFND